LELQLEDLEAAQAAAEPEPAQPADKQQRAARKPARRPLPADLPRETETIEPQQKACPDCGSGLKLLGADVSETLEYIPASFKVIRTVTTGRLVPMILKTLADEAKLDLDLVDAEITQHRDRHAVVSDGPFILRSTNLNGENAPNEPVVLCI
jgi:hypothetical protein